MPYYNRDPKKDHNVDNHPCICGVLTPAKSGDDPTRIPICRRVYSETQVLSIALLRRNMVYYLAIAWIHKGIHNEGFDSQPETQNPNGRGNPRGVS